MNPRCYVADYTHGLNWKSNSLVECYRIVYRTWTKALTSCLKYLNSCTIGLPKGGGFY